MGEHWQVRERFSKNQKAKYLNALRRTRVPMNNKDIKALNMACQVHSGQPVVEFKCHGPCSLYKHRDRFSKSQRRNRLRTPVLPAKSASRGQSSRTDIGQRLGSMSIRESPKTATSTMSGRQATATRAATENIPGQKMSPSITSTEKGTSSKQSVSSTGTNRTVQASTPTFAGCTPGFVPPHLQAARAGNGGYTTATGTSSVVSSDSRAGITNASMYSTTASRKGTGAMRSSGGPTSTAATTQTGRAANNPRRRPDRNGWARPDMRRTFDKQTQFATSAADYIETHESGSEDEI
ncbi:hypothetical protein PG984_005935 [Apiospora sp. TS-2023a]